MHGKSARTGAPLARAARGSEGHGRALLPCAVLLALVALFLMPTRAYADGANYRTVLYSDDLGDGKQYIVGADNKYDAAAYICGQTSAQVAAYDLTVRYKLSATENDFAAFADSLEKDWPAWNEDTLAQSLSETLTRDVNGRTVWQHMTDGFTTSGTTVGIKPIGSYLSLFQVDYWQRSVDCDIYAVDTTSDAVSRARDDLQEILNGGGGGGTVGETTTFELTNVPKVFTSDGSSSSSYTRLDGVTYKLFSTPSRPTDYPTGNKITITGMDSWIADGYDKFMVVMEPGGTDFYITVMSFKDEPVLNYNSQEQKLYVSSDTNFRYRYLSWRSLESLGITEMPFSANLNLSQQSFSTTKYQSFSYGFLVADKPAGTQPPDNDPGNWPDTPTNPNPDPQPPTVPDPPQNPEPDPPNTPAAPTPPPLEPPTNVTIPTGTTAADYTPWLRAILEQLQTLTDELASHCVHLQEEMQTSVNELQDTLIYRFNSLENYLLELFDGLENYLHDLAEWLAEQLSFNVNVDPYDDSSVLYWLRQIYSRLGNKPKSPTTVMDPDPTEPFDFWAWLMGLIANTVGGIIDDLVGDVAGLLDLFKEKFPFSIPWDIAALLTLFDGVRATPQFTVRLPAVEGWYGETVFNIDLTPYNSVAAVCRASVNIWWVMCLIMRTDWMLGVMDNATSFGERFARKVSRTS